MNDVGLALALDDPPQLLGRQLQLPVGLDAPLLGLRRLVRTAPAGQIVQGRRQLQLRIVVQRPHVLHAAFAERPLTQDERAVMVLQRTSQNLGGARAAVVRQHNQRQILVRRGPADALALIRLHPPARRDDFAFRQERAHDVDRDIQQPTGVVAHVQHQALHALGPGRVQRLAQLIGRIRVKTGQPDVGHAGVLVQHVVPRLRGAGHAFQAPHRRQDNPAARQLEGNRLARAGPLNRQHDLGAGRPQDVTDGVVGVPAGRALVIDGDDQVVGVHTRLERRRVFQRRDHLEAVRALIHAELDADALEAAHHHLLEIDRVGRPDHAGVVVQFSDRALQELDHQQALGDLDALAIQIVHLVEQPQQVLLAVALLRLDLLAQLTQPLDEMLAQRRVAEAVHVLAQLGHAGERHQVVQGPGREFPEVRLAVVQVIDQLDGRAQQTLVDAPDPLLQGLLVLVGQLDPRMPHGVLARRAQLLVLGVNAGQQQVVIQGVLPVIFLLELPGRLGGALGQLDDPRQARQIVALGGVGHRLRDKVQRHKRLRVRQRLLRLLDVPLERLGLQLLAGRDDLVVVLQPVLHTSGSRIVLGGRQPLDRRPAGVVVAAEDGGVGRRERFVPGHGPNRGQQEPDEQGQTRVTCCHVHTSFQNDAARRPPVCRSAWVKRCSTHLVRIIRPCGFAAHVATFSSAGRRQVPTKSTAAVRSAPPARLRPGKTPGPRRAPA